MSSHAALGLQLIPPGSQGETDRTPAGRLRRPPAARAQPCPIRPDPTGCSPPGSSVHGISQARMLEWVVISSSRGSSQPRDRTHVSSISCFGRQVLYATREGRQVPRLGGSRRLDKCVVEVAGWLANQQAPRSCRWWERQAPEGSGKLPPSRAAQSREEGSSSPAWPPVRLITCSNDGKLPACPLGFGGSQLLSHISSPLRPGGLRGRGGPFMFLEMPGDEAAHEPGGVSTHRARALPGPHPARPRSDAGPAPGDDGLSAGTRLRSWLSLSWLCDPS